MEGAMKLGFGVVLVSSFLAASAGSAADKSAAVKSWQTGADAASKDIGASCGCRIAFSIAGDTFQRAVDVENSVTLFRSFKKKTAAKCASADFKKKFCASLESVKLVYAADGKLDAHWDGKTVTMKSDNAQHTSSVAELLDAIEKK
jgi:hypothetical protein